MAAVAVVLGILGGGLGARADAAPPMLCPAPTFDPTIRAKYQEWGGSTGQLGCAQTGTITTGDGRALFVDFTGGSIYWRRSEGVPPLVVLGQVRDKWNGMGRERSPLGYPITDTYALFTPDGELGIASEFEGGAVYFAASTGAHEVHGSIAIHHLANRASFGFPTSDEQDFTEGGKVSYFQHGADYWWSDTGVIHVPRKIVVGYMGLIAYRQTARDKDNDDEPYVTIGAITPRSAVTTQTPVYEDVLSGQSRPEKIELYRGAPEGIEVSLMLTENDVAGFPLRNRLVVEEAVNSAWNTFHAALGPLPKSGPGGAITADPLLNRVVPSFDAVPGEDRMLGGTTIHLRAKELIKLSAKANTKELGVKWKYRSHQMIGDGAEYRLFLSVWNESA